MVTTEKLPLIGKKYKHYIGSIYTVIDIKDDKIRLMKDGDNSIYNIGVDMWNTPVKSDNNFLIHRFTKYSRKEAAGKVGYGKGKR